MAKDAATATKKETAKDAKDTKPQAPAEVKPAPEAKVEAEPKKPADPRLKVLKKFHGKFLPKGVLRERHKSIMDRWNSSDDHGGVTVDELKKLLDDWKGTREKPPRLPKA